MDFIIDAIVEWLKGLLVDGIMGNLDGLFDNVNQSVGEIATQVGTTPADWNAGVFSMIRQISETAILPIAGVILTFVMTYELIQMLIERNNLHEVDTWMFFKWVFKTFVAVMILTNTFNIVLAVFDVSQHVIQQSAGIIQNGTEITPDVLDSLRTELEAMELGPLFGLWLQSFLIQLTMIALNIVIFVIVYGRMIEIYLLTSLAPIPFATVPNRETGHMGQNYFRSLFAVGFQGLLILVCVAIYAVLIQSIATDGDPIGAIWGCVGYTVLLCFTLFKTGSLEIYVSGSLNVFNHETNVDLNRRLVCLDLKKLGAGLRTIAMLIMQDLVNSQVSMNFLRGIATWCYFDEFHVLLRDRLTASYCVAIWKMLRKKGCVPSALTQNVKDFLASPEIENIFENSDFLVLLSQAQGDRQILAKQLGISPHQLSYVTHTNSGEGLLFFGNTTIPFVDRFPQNTELYAIMTTRPEDKKQEMNRA